MNKQFVKDFDFTGNALWTEFMIYTVVSTNTTSAKL